MNPPKSMFYGSIDWTSDWPCQGNTFIGPLTVSHIHIGCIQSVLAPRYAVNGHMGTTICHHTCAGGSEF